MRQAGVVQFSWRRATLAGAAALVGAIAAAIAGLLLALLVGSVLGLPPGSGLISDAPDEGFAGALVAGQLVHRRAGGRAVPLLAGAAVLAVLGGTTTVVNSGTADWYVPLVVFGAPVVVMGLLSGSAPDRPNAASG
jgi:hypothetical protein